MDGASFHDASRLDLAVKLFSMRGLAAPSAISLTRKWRRPRRGLHCGRYVLVDDVMVMGGTRSDLADYIQKYRGTVVGVVALADHPENTKIRPSADTIATIERRYGDAVREEFGIEPAALTNAEASAILRRFKSADALRAGAAQARAAKGRGAVTRLTGSSGSRKGRSKPEAVVVDKINEKPRFLGEAGATKGLTLEESFILR